MKFCQPCASSDVITNSIHQCTECSKSFTQLKCLNRHIKDKHQPRVTCYICKKTMMHSLLSRHMKYYHPAGEKEETHECEVCDYIGPSEFALSKHMSIHLSKPFKCEICDFSSHRNDLLQHHWYVKHSGLPRSFKCDHEGCTWSFHRAQELKSHVAAIHERTTNDYSEKENRVVQLFTENGIAFDSQVVIKCSGTSRRPDFVIRKTDHIVIVEVDEQQHCRRDGDYEAQRMIDISETLKKRVLWIRYNPDGFKVNGVKRTPSQDERESRLLECVQKSHVLLGNSTGFIICTLFYNAKTKGNDKFIFNKRLAEPLVVHKYKVWGKLQNQVVGGFYE
jgi:hypothetical protein